MVLEAGSDDCVVHHFFGDDSGPVPGGTELKVAFLHVYAFKLLSQLDMVFLRGHHNERRSTCLASVPAHPRRPHYYCPRTPFWLLSGVRRSSLGTSCCGRSRVSFVLAVGIDVIGLLAASSEGFRLGLRCSRNSSLPSKGPSTAQEKVPEYP
jgi:hypothetical protein